MEEKNMIEQQIEELQLKLNKIHYLRFILDEVKCGEVAEKFISVKEEVDGWLKRFVEDKISYLTTLQESNPKEINITATTSIPDKKPSPSFQERNAKFRGKKVKCKQLPGEKQLEGIVKMLSYPDIIIDAGDGQLVRVPEDAILNKEDY